MSDAAVRLIREPEASVAALLGKRVAVLGFGSQGRSHALNLRDSGCHVVVAQRAGSPRHDDAVACGFVPVEIPTAVAAADVVIFALPDETAPGVYRELVLPLLDRGRTLGFIHGFAVHYRQIVAPPEVDVVLVAPKGQGRAVRSAYEAGGGVAGLIAVAQDASGQARETALAWAAGIGCGRCGIIETTFKDETETDLFGEQAVLCGGVTGLIKAAFETLVEAGYPAALAYFECCHELKLVVDLIYEGGITFARERISNTARWGDLTRGPRLIDERVRGTLKVMLSEIQSGEFAREWLAEAAAGRPRFEQLSEEDRGHALERVGAALREAMRGRL